MRQRLDRRPIHCITTLSSEELRAFPIGWYYQNFAKWQCTFQNSFKSRIPFVQYQIELGDCLKWILYRKRWGATPWQMDFAELLLRCIQFHKGQDMAIKAMRGWTQGATKHIWHTYYLTIYLDCSDGITRNIPWHPRIIVQHDFISGLNQRDVHDRIKYPVCRMHIHFTWNDARPNILAHCRHKWSAYSA